MELALTGGFQELNHNEVLLIEGGDFWSDLGNICAFAGGVIAILATGPAAAVAGIAALTWCTYTAIDPFGIGY